MFVQSHIQRHHHHNHHHQAHTSHSQHPHHHQHHNQTSHQHHGAKHTSAILTSAQNGLSKRSICAGSATVGLANATVEQLSCVTANVAVGQQAVDKHDNNNSSSQIPAHETSEIDFSSTNNRKLTVARQQKSNTTQIVQRQLHEREIIQGQAVKKDSSGGTEEYKSAIKRERSCRHRTRSLGSHKSLKVYDFMPRNARLASVEVAPTITTTTTTTPRREQLSSVTDTSGQSTLRLAQISSSIEESEPYRSRVRRLDLQETTRKPRRAFSDTSSNSESLGGGLWSLFAQSRQLIGAVLDAPCMLASGFASWTLLKREQPNGPTSESPSLIVRRNRQHQSVELIRSFCMSFVTYQYETWRLLARDLARENILSNQTIDSQLLTSRPIPSGRVDNNAGDQVKRSSAIAGGCVFRGRRFYSLDRPVLSRQREVVLDDETPVIRIPPIRREPSPVPLVESVPGQHSAGGAMLAGGASTQNHHRSHHQHSHRHVPSPMESYATNPVNFGQRDTVVAGRPYGYQPANQGEVSTVTRHEFKERAKFYLGQQSLDCDFMQTNRTIHEQDAAREDGSWSDRPLQEEDFQHDANKFNSSSVNGDCDQYGVQKIGNNLLSDSRLGSRKQRSLKKSTSPLSFEGARRRLGLKRKDETNQLSSISVNRSEEVIPSEVKHLSRQTTFNSLYDSGTESGTFWRTTSQLSSDPRSNFVEGIGVGQIASRQALVSPYLGDIQLSLSSRRGMLEVEVIRARGLHAKPSSKSLPSPYVKVYLMKAKKCIAKCRTRQANQTLNPLYQEPFVFRNEFKNCVLQVIVWGDYGKRDRKSMMGIVQIHLDDLDISNMVIGWYKLFNIPSMTNSLASSKILRQRLVHSTSISTKYTPVNI